MPLITVTYSPSNRSCCRNCYQKIGENSIRVGVYQKKGGGFTNVHWFHEKCFNRHNLWNITDIELSGLEELSLQDRLRVKDLFETLMNQKKPAQIQYK